MIPAEAEEESELSFLLSHLKICWKVSCVFQIVWMVPEEPMKRVS